VILTGAAAAQDLGPKDEPAAMSNDYNPLLWRGEDAQFAVNIIHGSYCRAEFSKRVAMQATESDLLSIARSAAAENEKQYRKLRQMGKSLRFEFPPKNSIQSCPEAEKARSLSGTELQKAYVSYLRETNGAAIQGFDAELARPEKPYNYGLRKFAEKELPALKDLQDKLSKP
jgi:hypothetical protein